MPSFGMYTVEGKLAGWLRPSGSKVHEGEAIAEIETEKALHEIEAPTAGILHHVANPGAELQVESLIGYILAIGEEPPSISPPHTGVAPSPLAREPAVASRFESEVRSSPIARRLAKEFGIQLSGIKGSGPNGRIVEADVRAAISRHGASTATDRPANIEETINRQPMSRMRLTIAERLRASLSQTVSLTLTREICAGSLVSARSKLSKKILDVSYDAIFIKVFAAALREHPQLNAAIKGNDVLLFQQINIGFAVSVTGGLYVPVIRSADNLHLTEVSAAVRQFIADALAGKLTPDDTRGGTATISNLGGYGVDAFTPILNPPQAAILGVGRIVKRPVIQADRVVPGHVCTLSLTFDHRVTDGVPAAQLLDSIARRIEDEQFLCGLM